MRHDAARSSARGRVGVERDDAPSRADYAHAQSLRLQHLDLRGEAERELARILLELEAHPHTHPTFRVRLARLLDAREPRRVVQTRNDFAARAQRRVEARHLRLETRDRTAPELREAETFRALAR